MVAVKYEDLSLAFDFVNSAPPGEHTAYISLDTGHIFWVSETNPVEDELPDDLDVEKRLVLEFVEHEVRHLDEQVQAAFRRRGAYARVKQLLQDAGALGSAGLQSCLGGSPTI